MNKVFSLYLGILCCFLSASTSARTIVLDVTMDAYEDFEAEEYGKAKAMANGWTVETDEYDMFTYHFQVKLEESDIPFIKWLGAAYVEIDKNFVLGVGMSIGDADAGTEFRFELPRLNNRLAPLPPVTIESSGGDYASGNWSMDAEIRLSVF